MQLATPGFDFALVETQFEPPGPLQVRVTVEACGICHSDAVLASGHFPGVAFPLVLGHEVAGRIDAIGEGVSGWAVGDRVAVGWYGGSCGHCDACRSGHGILCLQLQVPSVAYMGGYADSITVPAMALSAIPDGLSSVDAAPMACAGVTAFNALRQSSARPGDTVAILGLGGIGHLGVQFAAAMGLRTIAVARGAEKGPLAEQLGASAYIDSTASDVSAELQKLGGVKVVLATVTDADAMAATFEGLVPGGELVVVGFSMAALKLSPAQIVSSSKTIRGHASGIAVDVQDALKFAAHNGIKPWTEELPLADAQKAIGRMADGSARFRMVLTTGN
jgi:alcohol dehydrogenase